MAKRALVSVSDKSGLVAFVNGLKDLGWEIIATGGTQKLLEDNGVQTIGISDVTGFPEILDGRVKTLHPKVHGGILARRDIPEHMKTLEELGIGTIDLVCVNLYPFRQTIAKEGVTMADAIENIDIGGPSMVRSAAKNWKDVTIICDPADYDKVLAELRESGKTSDDTRLKLSAKAYTHTAEYDMCIATYMREKAGLNEKLFLEYDLKQPLRYGENPHQDAKFYAALTPEPFSLAFAKQIQGKELSYNNIQDANAALNVVRDFDRPFCVALKHMNPCGAAVADTIEKAWQEAYEADKVSIYGGIVAVNRELTAEVAAGMKPIFLEIVMAPSFAPDALELLRTKKNLRVLKVNMEGSVKEQMQCVSVNGGLLVQNQDLSIVPVTASQTVTETMPTEEQIVDLNFTWRIVKHVKSNAITVGKAGMIYGVGAGQMNRVGSAELALKQAAATLAEEETAKTGVSVDPKEAARKAGLVLASDAFFPFDDCVTLAAEYGVKAIVQPGGSVRDEDSIKKCNELGIAMVFTGERHFKH
ncbi:MAG TPA: bifunctional phosphoribosylaminoimidazolecarboxamide formyltransferase/inosine monophosphate cyclohydrolase [Rikenellaceae bacterium]|nr:bifunctional phosphoribosylaminoimidazolecarboxamide formyltransferase/inosine monophosphate cyclohydrolase [Rikenellaceae bacterium]